MDCPSCGGGPLVFIGTLGQLDWFRCRACGSEHSQEAIDRCPVCGGERDAGICVSGCDDLEAGGVS